VIGQEERVSREDSEGFYHDFKEKVIEKGEVPPERILKDFNQDFK